MEGVLVSAKRAGSTMTVTVVSNAQGQYRLPARAAATRQIYREPSGPWLRVAECRRRASRSERRRSRPRSI